MHSLINWVSDHDNKRLFIVLYIGLSLVLSIAISLFWLLFAVLIHFGFELIKQKRLINGSLNVFLESLWETKLDFALVVFAFWLAVYLDFIFGVVGIGAAARIGAQSASQASTIAGKAAGVSVRAAAWSRMIRAFLLSLDDVGNAAKAIYQSKKAKKTDDPIVENSIEVVAINNIPHSTRSSWQDKWAFIDQLAIGLFAITALLILLAPWLVDISFGEIIEIGRNEFRPLP